MATSDPQLTPAHIIADVAVLRREVELTEKSVLKLESAIEKIGNVAGDVAKILAVHDERIQITERGQEKLLELSEKRREEMQEGLDKVYVKLDDLKKAQDDTKKELLTAMSETKTEVDQRLDALERWRWMLMGAGLVVGFILGRIPAISEMVKQLITAS